METSDKLFVTSRDDWRACARASFLVLESKIQQDD